MTNPAKDAPLRVFVRGSRWKPPRTWHDDTDTHNPETCGCVEYLRADAVSECIAQARREAVEACAVVGRDAADAACLAGQPDVGSRVRAAILREVGEGEDSRLCKTCNDTGWLPVPEEISCPDCAEQQ